MNQEVLTLTPGGLALAQSLGFTAASVTVDNYTSSYVTLGDVGKTIPPWTYGAVVALPPGLRRATAVLTATVPAVPGPPVPVSQCTLTWTDAELTPSPGHLLAQSSFQTPQIVGVNRAPANTVQTKTFDVPAGTVAVGILAPADGGFIALSASVIGTQSGTTYKKVYLPQDFGGIYTALWVGAKDTQANLKVDNTGNGDFSAAYQLVCYPYVPGDVGPKVENGTPPFAGTNTAPAIGEIVTMFGTTPAPWQAATGSVTSRVAPGSLNTDFTIIAAVANKVIYLHDIEVNTNSGTSWEVDLWDGPSANNVKVADLFVNIVTGVGAVAPVPWDGKGRQLTSGNALVGTLANGQATATVFGTFGFSQQ